MVFLDNVSFSYAGAEAPAVRCVSLRLEAGEIVALVGANGSGKSTLARMACGAALPTDGAVGLREERAGQTVSLSLGANAAEAGSSAAEGADGRAAGLSPLAARRALREAVGLVQQDPRNQIVSSAVFDEVAFGPRNLGLKAAEVRRRVERSLAAVGLISARDRSTTALSGGEQQRLALAGVLAMEPRYLVLDEAASMLDGASRAELRKLVRTLARERKLGILSVTHDPLDILAADRVVELARGEVVWEGSPLSYLEHAGADAGSYPHALLQLQRAGALCGGSGAPLHASLEPEEVAAACEAAGRTAEARRAVRAELGAASRSGGTSPELERVAASSGRRSCGRGGDGLELLGVELSYGERPALRSMDLSARGGRVLLVAGVSGSGKSTAARVLTGLYPPDAGRALLDGSPVLPGDVGLAFQRPEDQLFCDTVRADVAYGLAERGLAPAEQDARVARAASMLGIDDSLLEKSPYELSGGWARRAAAAAMVALDPAAYVFDEPTAGLDADGRRFMHELVRSLAEGGASVAVVSHDVEEWLGVADEVALIAEGRVAWQGAALEAGASWEPYAAAGMRPPELLLLAQMLGASLSACDELGEVVAR